MTIWAKIAIFETTAKTLDLGRWGTVHDLQYGKKIKNSIRMFVFAQNVLKNPFGFALPVYSGKPTD